MTAAALDGGGSRDDGVRRDAAEPAVRPEGRARRRRGCSASSTRRVRAAAAARAVVSPNGDGVDETPDLRATSVVRPSTVTVDARSRRRLGAPRVDRRRRRTPGTYTLAWTGEADGTLERGRLALGRRRERRPRPRLDRRAPFSLDARSAALRRHASAVAVGAQRLAASRSRSLAPAAGARRRSRPRRASSCGRSPARSSAPGRSR